MYQTKEGVGPGTPIDICKKIYGTPQLALDTETNQESVMFKAVPWDKIRFGLIPTTGDYSKSGSVKTTKMYPAGAFIHYIEVRNR